MGGDQCWSIPLSQHMRHCTKEHSQNAFINTVHSQELASRLETLQQLVGGELESEGWTSGAVKDLLRQPTQLAVSGVLQVSAGWA